MIELKYKPLKQTEVSDGGNFGIREFGGLEFHPGIDYKAKLDDEIYAVSNGKVVVSNNDADGYGLYVVLEHDNYCTLYAHLKALILTVGQEVKAGDVIGQVGMTGMTTGPHLHFEIRDCLYDTMFWIKSKLKGRHAMCIDPKALVNEAKEVSMKVEFKKYKNGMTELIGKLEDLVVEIVDKRIWFITAFTNCVNGTFFWRNPNGTTYATSILYQDGKVYQDVANHYDDFDTPQGVFIAYKDGTANVKRIKFLSELDLTKIRLVVGGVALRNTTDPDFKYNPELEGFKKGYNKKGIWKDFTDVLRKTNKTVLGYNIKLKKCYLLTVPKVTHDELLKLISQGEAYDLSISLDGGGSTFMDALWRYVFKGEALRRIHNILRFK